MIMKRTSEQYCRSEYRVSYTKINCVLQLVGVAALVFGILINEATATVVLEPKNGLKGRSESTSRHLRLTRSLESFNSTSPSSAPSISDTPTVSDSPTQSAKPTQAPSTAPTNSMAPSTPPAVLDSAQPTNIQTNKPSTIESEEPSKVHSAEPTISPEPSTSPTRVMSIQPSHTPTNAPSGSKSEEPSNTHSSEPTESPQPSVSPTRVISFRPSQSPADAPSVSKSEEPSNMHSSEPTLSPKPSVSPTSESSDQPSQSPTDLPSVAKSAEPSNLHSFEPTVSPQPSASPTSESSAQPSQSPTDLPSVSKSEEPSNVHSSEPTESPQPSIPPTTKSSSQPSPNPTMKPTRNPTRFPSPEPTSSPTAPIWIGSTDSPTKKLVPSARPTSAPVSRPVQSASETPTEENDYRTLTASPNNESPSFTRAPQVPTPTLGWTDDFFNFPVDSLPPQGGTSPNQSPSTTGQPSQILRPTNQVSLTSRPNSISTPDTDQPVLLTREPTSSPSAAPSERQTISPTRPPTQNPTSQPTASPTPAPSPGPSIAASVVPTPFPTQGPTQEPTIAPSGTPTSSPTSLPTKQPSASPTQGPTPSPSSSPTDGPTAGPTFIPTELPTPQPSPMPSVTPGEPTRSPTESPTLEPTDTFLPSFSPTTSEPTKAPSPAPTRLPSENPTDMPSHTPSMAPSLPLQNGLVEALMSLSPYMSREKLSGQGIISWESVTENHIKERILQAQLDPEMIDLSVNTNIVDQGFPPASDGEGRLLQETTEDSLIISFDVYLTYRSIGTDHDLDQLVYSAWETEEYRSEYAMKLQSDFDAFHDVEQILVEVEGFRPPPTDPPGEPKSDGPNIAVVAGATVAGVALIFIVAFLFMRGRNEKEEEDNNELSRTTPDTAQKIAVATEILVEPQDDVSTLGDPMFAPGGMLIGGLDKDEVTASVGDDYDYTRQYRQMMNPASVSDRERLLSEDFTKTSSANSTTMSKLGRMGESLFSDDASFEQQFAEPEERYDVVAPAGKLGMVIDTPNGGMPVVHAIKETSVLADRVRVGDRLLSVDGEDCTAMTAMQVSKLISLKSEKPARTLVFARSRINTPHA